MADNLSTAQANASLSTIIGSDAAYIQLHTGDPGAAGTANISSTTTRMAVTWGAPGSGTVTASNQPAWASWAGTNGEVVSNISLWSALTGGTFGMSMPLGSSVTMATGNSLTLTSVSITIPTAS